MTNYDKFFEVFKLVPRTNLIPFKCNDIDCQSCEIMSEIVQVITLFVSYVLLFLAGMLAGYIGGVKKGVAACLEWNKEDPK